MQIVALSHSDSKFGKSHYDLAASTTHRCLTKGNDSEIESQDIDAALHNYESSVVNLKFPLPPPRSSEDSLIYGPYYSGNVEFLGSCRGFILVAYIGGDVIGWNPSTGVQRRIADDLSKVYQSINGFGYDRSTDDYLFVLIDVIPLDFLEDEVNAAYYPTRISLFSLKTNSWFDLPAINVEYEDLGDSMTKVGSLLNDALHWLVTSFATKLHVIVAFDLVQRSLSEIPLSKTLVRKLKCKDYHLRVMGECLSLCYPGDAASMAEIWMMKKYKVRSSWTKLFVFSTCNIPHNSFFPECFTKHGGIFGSDGFGRLMILNGKGWLVHLGTPCPEPDEYECFHIHCNTYRESLLSLPNDFEKASEDDQLTSSSEEASEDDQE